jgi:imidazolonepropionase-like amidohydrolase
MRHLPRSNPVTRLVALLTLTAAAIAAPAGAQTLAITNARIHPVSAPPIENGTVLIVDGTIKAVGAQVIVPAGATRIDAAGQWVTPGLVNASTRLGLVEIGSIDDTNDARARGIEQVAAALEPWKALNIDSVLWTPAREQGVTSVVTMPTGGLIAGQAALVDTAPSAAVSVRLAPVAMRASLSDPDAGNTRSRAELVLRLREVLQDAVAFAASRQAYETGDTRSFSTSRLHLEALGPVIRGELPLLVAVDRRAEIVSALDLAREFKLRLIVLGGAEAWMVADRLAAGRVPVLTAGLDNIPQSFAALGTRQENAALLQKAGVPVAIIADAGETFRVHRIRQHAGIAVAAGLPWDEALKAVTLTPAQIFGAADRIGSLQPGKDANLVVWSGDPFELSTRATHVFIRGRELDERSRQERLVEKYKQAR